MLEWLTVKRSRTRKTRLRTRLLIGLVSLIGLLGAVCVFLCFAIAHIPSWYRPPYVPEAEYQRVRDSMVDAVSRFSDDLVAGRPFEVTLSDRQVSEWIAIRAEVWPESEEWVPDILVDPVVAFQPDRLILAARLDKDGWQAIASAHLSFDVTPDRITIRLQKVAGGSLPLPIAAMAERLDSILRATNQDVDAMPDGVADVVRFFRERGAVKPLQDGVVVDNRFRWRNGQRWFRIGALQLEPGRLWMRIDPL